MLQGKRNQARLTHNLSAMNLPVRSNCADLLNDSNIIAAELLGQIFNHEGDTFA